MLAWPRRKAAEMLRSLWRAGRMGPASSERLSEEELRALSKDELVDYVLRHAPAVAEDAAPAARGAMPRERPRDAAHVRAYGESDAGQGPSPTQPPARKRQRREERPFDMRKYGQRMIAIKFAYLGWHFHGLASQPHSDASVEDHLFAALLRSKLIVARDDCDYSRAGRTDVGVSALGQVAGLRVRSNVVSPSSGERELDYVKMLNSSLPAQIRVLCWAPVSDGSTADSPAGDRENADTARNVAGDTMAEGGHLLDKDQIVRRPGAKFSARFDAIHRSYKYFFARGDLDIARMREACQFFVGQHDFRNFCKIDVEKVTNFVRVIYDVEIRRLSSDDPRSDPLEDEGEFTMYYLFVRGQAFLWHQLRCMAAILFEVGQGHESPTIVRRMLEDPTTGSGPFADGKPSYQMAPPGPLLLYDCAYPPSVVRFTVDVRSLNDLELTSFAYADAELSRQFGELAAQAAVTRSMLSHNDTVPVLGGTKDSGACDASEPTSEGIPFGTLRRKRFLLPRQDGRMRARDKHIPLERRMRETSVNEKKRRVAEKRARDA